jgi:hypothetical protein
MTMDDFVTLYIHVCLAQHHIGSPALDCLFSTTCHPCYPGEPCPWIPLHQGRHRLSLCDQEVSTPNYEATYRFTCVAACCFAVRNLRPLIAQTPLLRATGVNGQFPRQDLNLQDKQLLLHTVTQTKSSSGLVCR